MATPQRAHHSHRSRKPTQTYSLTVHGDTFHLVASAPAPPHNAVRRPISPLPPIPSPGKILDIEPSTTPSSSSLYVPCPPITRGVRRNLYIFKPTPADILQEQKRSARKAKAIEEARKAHEDDERRRNLMLGITVLRKSTRKVKARETPSTDLAAAAANHKTRSTEKKGPKGRASTKPTPTTVRASLASRQVSTSASASSAPRSLPANPIETPSEKKSRRKLQPKVNPRPTERLTTRSLARVKAGSITCGSDAGNLSVTPSEIGEEEGMEVDIDHRDTLADIGGRAGPQMSSQDDIPGHTHDRPLILRLTDSASLKPSALPQTPLEVNKPSLRRSSRRGLSNTLGSLTLGTLQELQKNERGSLSADSLPSSLPSRASSRSLGRGQSPLPQADTFTCEAEDINSCSSSSGGTQSSDTLCDVAAKTTYDAQKEVTMDNLITIEDQAVIREIDLIPPCPSPASTISASLQDNGASPTSLDPTTAVSNSALIPKGRGDKRKLGTADMDSNTVSQGGERRSSRVPKKRKFQ